MIDEYNDTDFDIVFNGTLLDFEDLTEVFTQAFERGELTAKLNRIPAKETSDKEILIDIVNISFHELIWKILHDTPTGVQRPCAGQGNVIKIRE